MPKSKPRTRKRYQLPLDLNNLSIKERFIKQISKVLAKIC